MSRINDTNDKRRQIIEGDAGAEVEFGRYSDHLLTTTNGYQWSGCHITPEIADMIIELMVDYKERKQ